MAIESYAVQLERVQAAIARIESGAQRVDYEGRHVTYADLSVLYAREKDLRLKVEREGRSGGIRVRLGTPTG